jgi:hypothetical protein
MWYSYLAMPDSGSEEEVQVAWSEVVEEVAIPSSVTMTGVGGVFSRRIPSEEPTPDQRPSLFLALTWK